MLVAAVLVLGLVTMAGPEVNAPAAGGAPGTALGVPSPSASSSRGRACSPAIPRCGPSSPRGASAGPLFSELATLVAGLALIRILWRHRRRYASVRLPRGVRIVLFRPPRGTVAL